MFSNAQQDNQVIAWCALQPSLVYLERPLQGGVESLASRQMRWCIVRFRYRNSWVPSCHALNS